MKREILKSGFSTFLFHCLKLLFALLNARIGEKMVIKLKIQMKYF